MRELQVLRGPLVALEEARTAGFTLEEWASYERDRIALQDARGGLTMAHRLGLERGRREGRAKGEAKGRAEGKAEGKAEGEAKGKAEAVLSVLAARGLEVTEEQRERILSATSATLLEGWLRQAITAASVAALFS